MAMDAVNQDTAAATPVPGHGAIVPPVKLAHIVLRTSRYAEVVGWYQTALCARTVYADAGLTFLTYDEEHHRIAVLHAPGLADQPAGVAGVHHCAFTYNSLGDLLENYARLRDRGIAPVFVINHGPTTSLYYADPDGNQLEFQCENFDSIEESTAFFSTPAFAENPIGVEFDPEEMLRRLRAGEPEAELKKRPDAGPKGLADVRLR